MFVDVSMFTITFWTIHSVIILYNVEFVISGHFAWNLLYFAIKLFCLRFILKCLCVTLNWGFIQEAQHH